MAFSVTPSHLYWVASDRIIRGLPLDGSDAGAQLIATLPSTFTPTLLAANGAGVYVVDMYQDIGPGFILAVYFQ